MKKVYIVLTHTGTFLSRGIRTVTGDEFTHVSISLDENLERMYSFGRLNPNNPFIGGFVQEYKDKGTFKRFFNTKARILELDVSDEQYKKMEKAIKKVSKHKEKYKFNVIGLLAAGLHKKIGSSHSFYCAEFVKYVLEKGNVNVKLPYVIKPEDFKNLKGSKVIYEGLLRKYNVTKIDIKEILRNGIQIPIINNEIA